MKGNNCFFCWLALLIAVAVGPPKDAGAVEPVRARDLGIAPGILSPGGYNAITDVDGVRVGHATLVEGDAVRTGVTVVLPHGENPFVHRVPAAVYVGNGFGKAVGFTQVQELGELETPVALTNTLSIHTVADGLADYVLALPGNGSVRSVNPVVGETNDGRLNDIRGKHVRPEHVHEAIADAASGPVAEGNVGAGTGTRAFGFKAGIGTSSRVLPERLGGYTVGVLVQSNFGGILSVDGAPVGEELGEHYLAGRDLEVSDGSIMIVAATDAPIDARNLQRLSKRAFMAIARTGGFASNGSGDYVIAFSTHPGVRIDTGENRATDTVTLLRNRETTPLFLAVAEATEEAILNSLFQAETMTGAGGTTLEALPREETLEILRKYRVID